MQIDVDPVTLEIDKQVALKVSEMFRKILDLLTPFDMRFNCQFDRVIVMAIASCTNTTISTSSVHRRSPTHDSFYAALKQR